MIALDVPNTLQVVHGKGCAVSSDGSFLRVAQGVTSPSYVTRATVFLNGWKLAYTGTGHLMRHNVAVLVSTSLHRDVAQLSSCGWASAACSLIRPSG
jgi:hypothetical protein